jgi:glutamate decarboxylase
MDHAPSFYGSAFCRQVPDRDTIPEHGMPARYCERAIQDYHLLDSNERLNTSSYVNVIFEPEEERVAVMGMKINLADQTVYPSSFQMHDEVVNMLGHLWHVPESPDGQTAGAGTVGSTEACLLSGLALKFRWRHWYRKRHNMTEAEVRGVYPNVVMSSAYQACWEKFFKYMDVEPILVKPSYKTMSVTAADLAKHCNEKTIAVVGIMGNHYGGQYDPIWDINDAVEKLNAENGWQIGIHVDAASGGFIAPFQDNLPAWDFRCKNVLSISASGHKFGQSVCGTGWVVWRQREELSEHVAVSVSYLGGKGDSYTLNFSRPASGVYVQFYKFNRLGLAGYRDLEQNMMTNAKVIRDGMKRMTKDGKPRFVMLDNGDDRCLPVVTAMLNPDLNLGYDDIRLQYVIAESHWYVSAYKMSFTHPATEETEALFCDMQPDQTMFRIVVKSNLTAKLALHLLKTLQTACEFLDEHSANFITHKMKKRMSVAPGAHLNC